MYSPEDIKNLDEIKLFLDDNNIDYSTEYDNFCLHFGNPDGKRFYEICYVPSQNYPISYPKYGISGVDMDYFLNHHISQNMNKIHLNAGVKTFAMNVS